MIKYIKDFGVYAVMALIIIILLVSKCNNNNSKISKSDTTYTHFQKTDTTFKDSLAVRIQYVVKTVEIAKASQARLDSFSQASKNYDSLLAQYDNLKGKYLAFNKSKDTIPLPNKGYVSLEDVVSENQIISRKPTVFSRDKIITVHDSTVTTITNVRPPIRQVLLGAEITGNQYQYFNGASAIAAYKDRKDRQYQIKVGMQNMGGVATPQYGLGLLWPLNK